MKSCKIIMYHYVRPIKKSAFPEIKGLELERFVRQINYFKNKFTFINIQQLLDCIYKDSPLPYNSVILTFDDGMKDHYSNVFPILKREKIQGAFFPPAKPISENTVLDVHKIHFILASSSNKQELVDEIFRFINQFKDEYELQKPESYFDRLANPSRFDTKETVFIKRILQRDLPPKVRSEIVNYLFKKLVSGDERNFSKQLYLNFDEIQEMREGGMYFGSHGYAHEWLSHLSNANLESEIHKSLEFYHKINGEKENLIMCYPYGDYNSKTIKKLENKGFKAGLTTEIGDAELTIRNALKLKRYDTNDFFQ